jgi:hypothetical protein
MVLAPFVLDVALGFRQKPAEFEQCLPRQDDAIFVDLELILALLARYADQREPVTVRGDQAH